MMYYNVTFYVRRQIVRAKERQSEAVAKVHVGRRISAGERTETPWVCFRCGTVYLAAETALV